MYTNPSNGCTPMYINADIPCDKILEFFDEMGKICTFPFLGCCFPGDARTCIRDGLPTQLQDAGNAGWLDAQFAQPTYLLFRFGQIWTLHQQSFCKVGIEFVQILLYGNP